MYRIIIFVLLIFETNIALSQNDRSEKDSVALYALQSSHWNALLDSILKLNGNCSYLKTNPVYFCNVFVRTHELDTIVTFSFVQHSPNMYFPMLKPNVVFKRNGIRFYVRYTDAVERDFVKKHFVETGRNVIWKFSDSIHPHYSVGHINVVDGLTVETMLFNNALLISKIIPCATD